MTTLNFSKMHGLGNDFVVIDATRQDFPLNTAQISQLGHRKTGIGFDQMLVVEPSCDADADFRYRIFNTDGSEVEHCGNGARCFAKFVFDQGLTNKKQLRVNIKKGNIDIIYHDDDNIVVAMGKPIVNPSSVPFTCLPDEYQSQYELELPDGSLLPASVLSMGNPHVVLFVSDVWQLDIDEMGKTIQQLPCFPESVNVNFAEIIDGKTLHLRTFERGVGETHACGTGACASAFAAISLMAIKSPVNVLTHGGHLEITIDEQLSIYMKGSSRHVFDGQITL